MKKSLYIFLASWLGALLFLIIERSVSLIYFLLLTLNYDRFSFGLTELQLYSVDIALLMIALFFGGWYGVWLGLHWYEVVYEWHGGGWLYALRGKLFHSPNGVAPGAGRPFGTNSVTDDARIESLWQFDDLLEMSEPAAVKLHASARKAGPSSSNRRKNGASPIMKDMSPAVAVAAPKPAAKKINPRTKIKRTL